MYQITQLNVRLRSLSAGWCVDEEGQLHKVITTLPRGSGRETSSATLALMNAESDWKVAGAGGNVFSTANKETFYRTGAFDLPSADPVEDQILRSMAEGSLVRAFSGFDWKSIHRGFHDSFFVGLTEQGEVWTWGTSPPGLEARKLAHSYPSPRLINDDFSPVMVSAALEPVRAPNTSRRRWSKVASNYHWDFWCAIDVDGQAFIFDDGGKDVTWVPGVKRRGRSKVRPLDVSTPLRSVSIAKGATYDGYVVALSEDGRLFVWDVQKPRFCEVKNDSGWLSLSTWDRTVVAVDGEGVLHAGGWNYSKANDDYPFVELSEVPLPSASQTWRSAIKLPERHMETWNDFLVEDNDGVVSVIEYFPKPRADQSYSRSYAPDDPSKYSSPKDWDIVRQDYGL